MSTIEKGVPFVDTYLQNIFLTWLFCISTPDKGLTQTETYRVAVKLSMKHVKLMFCSLLHITYCIWITVATQITLQWNTFTQIGAMRSVDWTFIVGAPTWRCLGECVTLGRTFYSILFKQKVAAITVAATFSSFVINTIIILGINHYNLH